jgi:hypothetical protein
VSVASFSNVFTRAAMASAVSAVVLRSMPLTSQMSSSSADGSANVSVGTPLCLFRMMNGNPAPAGASAW